MIDHRRIQRTLFRMQHDPAFAKRLRAREPRDVASTGLGDDDLSLLLDTGTAGIDADAGGKRVAQFLRNVSSEHALSVAWSARGAAPRLVESFASSEGFHHCIVAGSQLPLAFGYHAVEIAQGSGDALLQGLVQIELAMAQGRRSSWTRRAPAQGELVLSEIACALDLPAGTMDAAASLRVALDAGQSPPSKLVVSVSEREQVLIVRAPAASPHSLCDVSIEQLSELAGAFVMAAEEPLGAGAIAAFCAEHEVSPEELGAFTGSLVEEGVLVRGG